MLILLLLTGSWAQETALITGGFNGFSGCRVQCELLNSGCLVPELTGVDNTTRSDRESHVTALTEDGLILTCGGEAGDGTDDLSCITLDTTAMSWIPHSVLMTHRVKATSVSLPGTGLFILGGFGELTSEMLPVGATVWEEGPRLPGIVGKVSYYGICSIVLSSTDFLVIGGEGGGSVSGTRVQQYSVTTGDWQIWSDLRVPRWGHSCTRLDDLVVVAGGVSPQYNFYSSTTVLDLNTREERMVGDMVGPRAWFGMSTIEGKVVAYGGMAPRQKDCYSNILEWDPVSEEWIDTEESMVTNHGISSFAAITVRQEQICRS